MARTSQKMVLRALGMEGTCLTRSLTLRAMLRRRGIDAHLHVGYRKLANKFEGHAWLEIDGRPVNDNPATIATYTLANGTGKIWWT